MIVNLKKARCGPRMKIMQKVPTAITSSPKKFLNRLCLFGRTTYSSKDEHEKVSVNIKVLNILDPITVPTGKKCKKL